ncbi:MAG: hypothetical protein R3305_12240 [Gammaproteobacteria bacterium]|nr:hypothetical protein [Gammaproteobacteria bacterium]
MEICHPHNLVRDQAAEKRFGIRVRVLPTDSLSRVIGSDFERTYWYETRVDRDRALADMAGEHVYSRRGDRPTLRFEPIDR